MVVEMKVHPSIKELREICQKPVINENCWYARNFTRRISIYFTKLFLYTPLSANQITVLMTVIGVLCGFLFAFGNVIYSLLGALLLQFWYVLDHVDGEVARYKKIQSLTGEYLDYLAHVIVHPAVFVGITFGVYQKFPNLTVFVLGFIASLSLILFDLVHWHGQQIVLYPALVEFLKKSSEVALGSNLKNKRSEMVSGKADDTYNIVRNFGYIFNKMLFIWHYPAIMNIICLAAVLNIFYPFLRLGSFEFSFMYLIIIFYGITLPLLSALLLFGQVIIKYPDRAYNNLINNLEMNKNEEK